MPTGVYKHKPLSKDRKKRLSEFHKGKRLSVETKRKISKTKTSKHLSGEHKQKISKALRGRKGTPLSAKVKRQISQAHKGKHLSKEHIKILTERWKGQKNPRWKGGITGIRKRIHESKKYSVWRQHCVIRDDFTCQKCGDKSGGNLDVHHKKPFRKLLEEIKKYLPLFNLYDAAMFYTPLWDITNGITLCKKCHTKINNRK